MFSFKYNFVDFFESEILILFFNNVEQPTIIFYIMLASEVARIKMPKK